jgi:hypothetical protein
LTTLKSQKIQKYANCTLKQVKNQTPLLLGSSDFIEMEVSAHSEMTWYRALSLLELGERAAAEDLRKRNQWESKYLLALAEAGLGHGAEAVLQAEKVLQLNAMHTGARDLLEWLSRS